MSATLGAGATPSTSELDTFAQRMAHARAGVGLNQTELARLVGCSPQAVSWMESDAGGGISVDNLFKVADALQVSPRWLATGREDGDIRPLTHAPDVLKIASNLAALPEERLRALAVVLGIKL